MVEERDLRVWVEREEEDLLRVGGREVVVFEVVVVVGEVGVMFGVCAVCLSNERGRLVDE